METIIINPDNKRQSKLVKTMLKEMRISLTSHTDETEVEVSAAELESIDKGLEDIEKGNVTPHHEAKKRFYNAIYNME
ncbi:MAG: hypothetical protein PHV53_08645 [Fermentimonas sp.]|nr:hypothetical protein [Fermentimonas sp.]